MSEQGYSEKAMGPPPRLKDRYRLVEQVGRGSMGVVYRARDEVLDRDVAIKFLSPEQIVGREASARFLREARAVARLSHPNIMTLYDVDREGDWHYLVLEYIPGRDLHSLMVERGGPLPTSEALQAMRGVLEALAYAHARGLVHRDIKPENVLVSPGGRVKVADFGLALARGDVRLTQEGAIIGTVLYIAPEIVRGEPADSRTDLYAVGAVLYELLTGQPPFTADDPLAVISRILNTPIRPPRALVPDIAPAVERVILKLLAKDPNERYALAEDVLAALPDPSSLAEAEDLSLAGAVTERTALPLLERIVRSSSMGELFVYAALEDATLAVEAERRRLATLLQSSAIEPINLLLSQASAYEQTLAANPTARMAVSVLATLARQVLQQVRDLEANLHPTILDNLGLEPALETLADQARRAHGLQVILAVERMRERLPPSLELALFRVAQEALDRALRYSRASQVTICLERRGEQLVFKLADNGIAAGGEEAEGSLHTARQRIEQLGGVAKTTFRPQGGFELTASFSLESPPQLTPREMEVIQLVAEGLSNKEIAHALSISPRTVNFHLDNIYSKLGVSSRTEAAIYAIRHGWVRRS